MSRLPRRDAARVRGNAQRSAAVRAGGKWHHAGRHRGPGAARVRAALEKAKWRREKAAEILGVSPRTLYRWMKRLGL